MTSVEPDWPAPALAPSGGDAPPAEPGPDGDDRGRPEWWSLVVVGFLLGWTACIVYSVLAERHARLHPPPELP